MLIHVDPSPWIITNGVRTPFVRGLIQMIHVFWIIFFFLHALLQSSVRLERALIHDPWLLDHVDPKVWIITNGVRTPFAGL